jgi:hypothetical protein
MVPGRAVAQVGLEVISDDSLATVQILDQGMNLLKTGLGSVRESVAPGFYRLHLITPEGQITEELLWLPPGSGAITVPLAAPSLRSGLVRTLAEGAGLEIEKDNIVRIPSAILAAAAAAPLLIAAPTVGTLLALAGAAAFFAKPLGVMTIPAKALSGLRFTMACDSPVEGWAAIIRDLRLRTWRQAGQPSKRHYSLQPNTRFERVAGMAKEFKPGAYWVQIFSPQLSVNWVVSTVVVTGYETILNLELAGAQAHDASLSCVLRGRSADSEDTERYLRQSLAQRALRSGRLDLAREYADSLAGSVASDPLSAFLLGYVYLKQGAREELGAKDFMAAVSTQFPGISDAHVLWAVSARPRELARTADVEAAYIEAAKLGVPIFAEGLRWLALGCRQISDRKMFKQYRGKLDSILDLGKRLVRGQHLAVLNSDGLVEPPR